MRACICQPCGQSPGQEKAHKASRRHSAFLPRLSSVAKHLGGKSGAQVPITGSSANSCCRRLVSLSGSFDHLCVAKAVPKWTRMEPDHAINPLKNKLLSLRPAAYYCTRRDYIFSSHTFFRRPETATVFPPTTPTVAALHAGPNRRGYRRPGHRLMGGTSQQQWRQWSWRQWSPAGSSAAGRELEQRCDCEETKPMSRGWERACP